MKNINLIIICILFAVTANAQPIGTTINLNGTWDFEQTVDAFPPRKFMRKCPVPGLVILAQPRIEAYNKIYKKPEEYDPEQRAIRVYRDPSYEPRYSWYRRTVEMPKDLGDAEAVLTILKAQYVAQVYVNGKDMGQSIACYTPIRMHITRALKPGTNEIMIRLGERVWLPPAAAGSTDQEKANYLPGIWDDVFISFSGNQKVLKNLFLPSVKGKSVTAKLMVRSFYPQPMANRYPNADPVRAEITIREKKTGRVITSAEVSGNALRDNETALEKTIPFPEFTTWSPENPFLYEAEIRLYDGEKLSDITTATFGMRDFERRGKFFYLNGEKYYLRGTNVTLHRFFEDPDCQALPWDREWVKRMLIDDPKSIGWNSMRICVGLVPKFWYELADEHGMMFQNEWMYWQHHGWDQQIREEFTDWVWSDGNHPSIVIWDAINENKNEFIGNVLVPELRKLDPTRIWDAGYMQAEDMAYEDPIDEPHLYRMSIQINRSSDPENLLKTNPYRLGKLDDWEPNHLKYKDASAAQLVNEYGHIWLWRDGRPAKLSVKPYRYILGDNATVSERRELQAYWLQCETEWIRAERTMAGVLAFSHLTNNYGYTGDWYINNIKDLQKSITFYWLGHAFAPANVFIDLADQRYFQNGHYQPGEQLAFNLAGVNDLKEPVTGKVDLILMDATNKAVFTRSIEITIPGYGRINHPMVLDLPNIQGGYLITTRFTPNGQDKEFKSRRYIRVGSTREMSFPKEDIGLL